MKSQQEAPWLPIPAERAAALLVGLYAGATSLEERYGRDERGAYCEMRVRR